MKMDPSNRTCFSRKLGIVYKEKYVLMFCKKTNMHKKFHSLTNVICMTIGLFKYQTFSALSRWSLVIFDLQKPTGNWFHGDTKQILIFGSVNIPYKLYIKMIDLDEISIGFLIKKDA